LSFLPAGFAPALVALVRRCFAAGYCRFAAYGSMENITRCGKDVKIILPLCGKIIVNY